MWHTRTRYVLPPLCKKMSLTTTFELKHLGWRFWCLDLCFWSQASRWCHLFCPMTLTFQGHNYVKSHFGPYLGSCWTKCHQILTLDSLGRGLLTNQKISWVVWTCDIRERITLATIMQKTIFDHNFRTKALRMTIFASRYMFLRSKDLMVSFVFTYDLDLSRSWPCKITGWAISQLLKGQTVAKI